MKNDRTENFQVCLKKEAKKKKKRVVLVKD